MCHPLKKLPEKRMKIIGPKSTEGFVHMWVPPSSHERPVATCPKESREAESPSTGGLHSHRSWETSVLVDAQPPCQIPTWRTGSSFRRRKVRPAQLNGKRDSGL